MTPEQLLNSVSMEFTDTERLNEVRSTVSSHQLRRTSAYNYSVMAKNMLGMYDVY